MIGTATRGANFGWVVVMALLAPLSALADATLALDKGCFNCHSAAAPRKGTPSFEQLAADYSRYRGQPEALPKLAAKLHEGSLFGHIAAHERLRADEAAVLVQWIIEGAR
ncbi:MAG: cytochrome C [Burkholderiaceae bacterium]|nr:cytochrome C [Burkholderiaceae bacterium]MDZ4143162.1 cytochrome C [Burkholderiales bacterium]